MGYLSLLSGDLLFVRMSTVIQMEGNSDMSFTELKVKGQENIAVQHVCTCQT